MARRMIGIRLSEEEEQIVREALPLWDAERKKLPYGNRHMRRWDPTLGEFARAAVLLEAQRLIRRQRANVKRSINAASNERSSERQTLEASK